MKNKAFIVLLVISFIALSGFGCRRPNEQTADRVIDEIVVWGLWQDSAMMDDVIRAFESQTGVKVEYRKIASVATYERTLLEALAQGRGPDVFVIHHTWVEGKRSLMSPAPEDVINTRMLADEFVTVVPRDLVRNGLVYALPTSVDTLALYYNEDMLNAAGVSTPPRTWEEFQQAVERLTRVSRLGFIEQSGAAIGTAENINRAMDILQMLMIQSGIEIAGYQDDRFNVSITNETGERALTFYTDFSNRSKRVFTWDIRQDYSIDAFSEGNTAMMFNYSHHIPTVRAKNPRLRFSVAPVPQISDSSPAVFANYWPFAVSNTSRAPRTAWNFVRFLTSKEAAKAINDQQGAPPARRDSIAEYAADPFMGVFAEQALNAVTWPRVDVVAIDDIFNTMIDDVATGGISTTDALRRAEDRIRRVSEQQ